MICNNCGNYYEDDKPYCPACGTPNPVNSAPQPEYQQNNFNPQAQQPYYNPIQETLNQHDISSAHTLGTVAIICSFIGFYLVSWICGGIGLSKMNRVLVLDPNNAAALHSKKLCKIGLILSIVFYVLLILLAIAGVALGMFSAFSLLEEEGIDPSIFEEGINIAMMML